MGIFFKSKAAGFVPAEADALTERAVHPVPPNLGHGNSFFDSLWLWLVRETTRALTRALFGQELPSVSPLVVSAGHRHDEEQEAALPWLHAGTGVAWFDESSSALPGAALIESSTEVDVMWLPLSVPAGVSLLYFKLRVGTEAAADEAMVRVRLYTLTGINGPPVEESAFIHVRGDGSSPLGDSWLEVGPLSAAGLTSEDGITQGWARVSGLVGAAGQKVWVNEVTLGLRQGV